MLLECRCDYGFLLFREPDLNICFILHPDLEPPLANVVLKYAARDLQFVCIGISGYKCLASSGPFEETDVIS